MAPQRVPVSRISLSDKQADVIVGDILDLAGASEAAGQPAWHV